MAMNQLLETKMRYQSFENLTGKTNSDRRWNFFKLLIGIIVGKWIGDTYCVGPRCFDTLESVGISGRDGNRNNKNGDQTYASDDSFQVYNKFSRLIIDIVFSRINFGR